MARIPAVTAILARAMLLVAAGGLHAELPPAADEPLKRGRQALADRLPDIAALRFEEALQVEGLPDADRQRLLLLLADAQVRSGEAAAALDTLSDPVLEDAPEAGFWRGQALAGLGRFDEAAATLAPIAADPSHPLRAEAAFSRSGIQLSLGDAGGAGATLEPLLDSPQPAIARRARLRLAEIAFDLRRFKEARETLAGLDQPEGELAPRARYLDGRLLLEEGRPSEAAAIFRALATDQRDQSTGLWDRARIGLAIALAAAGDATAPAAPADPANPANPANPADPADPADGPTEAGNTLIAFIANSPHSPLLGEAFKQLLALVPEDAPPSDPILEQIAKWLPAPQPGSLRPVPLSDGDSDASGAWPSTVGQPESEVPAFASYHLAGALRRTGDPAARARAFSLLRHLQLEYPGHFLARRGLLDIGRWHLEDGRIPAAQAALDALIGVALDPELRALASFLRADSSVRTGDHAAAAEAFARAAAAFDGEAAEAAAIDAGISRLLAGDLSAFEPGTETRNRVASELALERALLLAARREPSALALLDRFIIDHPQHPRLAEARLALASLAMAGDQPDLELVAAQLDTLASDPSPGVTALALADARIRLAELQGAWDRAAETAATFLDAHPEDPGAAGIRLRLGQALFRKGDYNAARLVLGRLAETAPTSPTAEAALFLAARCAALGATSQARTESLDLYDRVARINGTLADSARLEKARTLIDMGRFDTAISELQEWGRSLDSDSRLGFAVGTLLGEALFAKGGNDPASFEDALALYRELVGRSAPESALNHRFRYLMGLTLERLERPGEALDTYYSLLESAALHPPLEWEWLERAGFRTLALLESNERWEAATAVAERIAALGGPRAAEAAERARKLRLEHMIWEETTRPAAGDDR